MSTLQIAGGTSTPEVKFNLSENYYEISGRSMPENSLKFYTEIQQWLKDNLVKINEEIQFLVKLEYYNTGTYVRLMEIFNFLSELHNEGKKVKVVWFYDRDDEDHLEDGKAFAEVVTVPFHFEPND